MEARGQQPVPGAEVAALPLPMAPCTCTPLSVSTWHRRQVPGVVGRRGCWQSVGTCADSAPSSVAGVGRLMAAWREQGQEQPIAPICLYLAWLPHVNAQHAGGIQDGGALLHLATAGGGGGRHGVHQVLVHKAAPHTQPSAQLRAHLHGLAVDSEADHLLQGLLCWHRRACRSFLQCTQKAVPTAPQCCAATPHVV